METQIKMLSFLKVAKMPVTRWKYKGTTQEHTSPYADDFKNFGLGSEVNQDRIQMIHFVGVLYA